MNEQVKQDSAENVALKGKKGRSQEEKIGRIRYNQFLLKQVKAQNVEILAELRWIRRGLKKAGYTDYDEPTVENFAIRDQVDAEILQRIREVGTQGIFPKDVAEYINKIKPYGLRYYDVSRRIVRMNKRLHFETGELLFEKRGHKWALTFFASEVLAA